MVKGERGSVKLMIPDRVTLKRLAKQGITPELMVELSQQVPKYGTFMLLTDKQLQDQLKAEKMDMKKHQSHSHIKLTYISTHVMMKIRDHRHTST